MPINTQSLIAAIETLLLDLGAYDVDSSGWLNENDIDPDFVGYAQWTLDPPYEFDFMAWQDGMPPSRVATAREQRLMEIGIDFIGLMKASRYAIGSVLLHRKDVSPGDPRPIPFEFHEISAFLTLSMASDRLRDFLIVALLDEHPRFGHELDQLRLALCTARRYGLDAEALELEAMTPRVQALKSDRNRTVHRVALDEARVQKQLMEEERKRTGRKGRPPQHLDYGESVRLGQDAERVHREEIENRVSRLRASYSTLVKSGDLVFRLEHRFRDLRRQARP